MPISITPVSPPTTVLGPASATDNAHMRFDGATGTLAKNGKWIESNNGAISVAGSTITANEPILSLAQTWNSAGVTFVGVLLSITSTASAAASKPFQIKVGGSEVFSVSKTGAVIVPQGYSGGFWQGEAGIGAASATGWISGASATLNTAVVGGETMMTLVKGNGVSIGAGRYFGWRATTDTENGALDLTLFRDAANTLAQRNGTTAQVFRLYNTFTDATNYERAGMVWAANDFYFTVIAQGSGSARAMTIGTQGAAALNLWTDSTLRWSISSTGGHFLAGTDATYNFGAPGATRPLNLYLAGKLFVEATVTAGGTTGAQTIDKAAGTVNMAAGQSALVVTCNKATASSLIFAVVRTNDATATIKNVVAGSGTFTITLTATATAETSLGFFIVEPD